MAYSDFKTLNQIKKEFHLSIDESLDLSHVPEIAVGQHLAITLEDNIPLAVTNATEKARSELLISPVLVEIWKLTARKYGLLSGAEFTVDPSIGLNGICDFILTQSPEVSIITAPVLMLVEAKNENLKEGIAQCAAELVAARIFNKQEGRERAKLTGVSTTGSVWRFFQLIDSTLLLDRREYYIDRTGQILGILLHLIT